MGQAGQSTRKMAADRRSRALVNLCFAAVIIVVLLYVAFNSQAMGLSGFGLLGLTLCLMALANFFISRSDRYAALKRRAIRGARGEEVIERVLNRMGSGFYALHDIECQYGNIDHLVLSQHNGVFLIETKAHGGRVRILEDRLLVNERPPEKDFIAQSLRNTYWLKEKLNQAFGLDVWITPVVVFANAFVSRGKPIKGVVVINKKYLPDLLRHGRSNYASLEIWNRREDVAGMLGLPVSMPVTSIPIPPSTTSATPAPQKPHRTEKAKRPFGLTPQQFRIVIGFFIFDLIIVGTGLALALS